MNHLGGNVTKTAGYLGINRGTLIKRIKDYGVHEKQALVIVNYGKATGKQILDFSISIQKAIKFIFDIDLDREVNVI